MDSVNASNDLASQRFAHLYQSSPEAATRPGKASSHLKANELPANAVSKTEKPEPFSNLFEDKDLARLQNNLESVAQLAEAALKRFGDRK